MEAAEVEDDMMMVIVIGDEDEIILEKPNGPDCIPKVEVKEEPLDEQDVQEILAAAESYGQKVDIEYERAEEDDDEENLDPTFQQALINLFGQNEEEYYELEALDNNDEEYVDNEDYVNDDDYVAYNDLDYVPSQDEDREDSDFESVGVKRRGRHAMLPAAQRKSFIDDLRQQYPELARNEKNLIKTVAEIMRNIKAPNLPKSFCTWTGDSYECDICQSLTISLPAAGRHWQEKHGPRYLVCFACGVDFRSKTNLYKHEKRCMALPDAIIMLKARAIFLGRKARGRPYIPDLSTIPQLKPKNHNRFPCSECSATFTTKTALTSHENMHRGERPFWCDKCPSRYTSLSALTRHQHKHSGRKYICDTCNAEFKVKAAIAAHMDTHNPIPKFPCKFDDCQRRFTTKNALNHHVRRQHLHLPMPCACQICPARYPRMSLLRDHMKSKHGMALMTRKMFFKALPRLTEAQIQQAKVILKGEGAPINLSEDLTIDSARWRGGE